jgi:hypothetical protein
MVQSIFKSKRIFAFFQILAIFCVIIFVELQFSFSAMGTFLCGLLFMLIIFGPIFVKCFNIERKLIRFFIGLAIVVLTSFVTNPINKVKVSQSEVYGFVLIDAIEQFNKKNGFYPSKLEELKPEFIANIKASEMKIFNHPSYKYRVNHNDNSYRLSFPKPSLVNRLYSSKNRNWVTED